MGATSRARRWAWAPALAALAGLLSACGPGFSGYAAVTVEDGELVIVVRTCDVAAAEVRLYETSTSGERVTLVDDDNDIDDDTVSRVRTGVLLADLGRRATYEVDPVAAEPGAFQLITYLIGVSVQRADLEALEPGQVAAPPSFTEPVPDGLDHVALVDEGDFVDTACDD